MAKRTDSSSSMTEIIASGDTIEVLRRSSAAAGNCPVISIMGLRPGNGYHTEVYIALFRLPAGPDRFADLGTAPEELRHPDQIGHRCGAHFSHHIAAMDFYRDLAE